jgi:nitroreductase
MDTLSPTALLATLRWRYATKQFDASKKIPADLWATLEDALILTPSSFGLQPWKFLVVTSQEVKEALVPASWRQTQPADCSHHVVFAAKADLTEADVDRFLGRQVELRGGTTEALKGYRNVIVGFAAKGAREGWLKEWAIRQVYIAIGNFMTSAAVLGVDTCPMEGIAADQYDRILGLEGSGYTTVVACAAGYRLASDKYATEAKVRYPANELIQRI